MIASIRILFLCGIIVFAAFSCNKENTPEWFDFVEGNIVGTFICDEDVSENGQGTGSKTDRGYCILLDGSENTDSYWPMDFYTFDQLSEFFDFPFEILSVPFDGSNCGPVFSPDSLRNKYKISFKYREPKESERVFFTCGGCIMMDPTFRWMDYNQIILKDITKIIQ